MLEGLRLSLESADCGALEKSPLWHKNSSRLVAAAEEALQAQDMTRAAVLLRAAERESVFGMAEAEVRAKVTRLQAETETSFSSWDYETRSTMKDMVRAIGDADSVENQKYFLKECLRLLDEKEQEKELYSGKINSAILKLSGLLGILLLLGVWIVYARQKNAAEMLQASMDIRSFRIYYVDVCVFGAMGAVVSGIYRLIEEDWRSLKEEPIAENFFVISFPLTGAAFGIILVGAFQSGFLAGPQVNWGIFIWVLAFAAGFSERLVPRVIQRVGSSAGGSEERSRGTGTGA